MTPMLAALLLLCAQERHKDPTPGPPWTTDAKAARRDSLRTGRPVFVYFTKTY